ncbi:cell cycle protein [Synergistales bacterium]|nr:cell cycle protein [Synergistales bacterium]
MRGEAISHSNESIGVKTDPLLWIIPLILSGIGIIMVTSTTSPISFETSGTPFMMGLKQLQWLVIGMCAMIVVCCVPLDTWHKKCSLFWILSLILCCATLVHGIGSSVGGARRWIRVAGISLQPAEILTLSVVVMMAKILIKSERDPIAAFKKTLLLLGISATPLLFQPDLGSILLISMICMGMYVERFGWRLPIFTGCAGAVILVFLIAAKPYRMRRFYAWSDPWSDPLDKGFQAIQGLIAFANGGLSGTGLGHGFQKLQYLPAAYTDFIYAAMGEELGVIGTLGVIFLCVLWTWRCRSLYNKVTEGFDTVLVWGITLTIAVPFFINIAGVTNTIPLTGMPMPFISYGGSAIVMMWARVGLLMRIYKEHSELRLL